MGPQLFLALLLMQTIIIKYGSMIEVSMNNSFKEVFLKPNEHRVLQTWLDDVAKLEGKILS